MRTILTVVLCVVAVACGRKPTPAELDADNPVTPNPPSPFGVEEFFAGSQEPDPKRVRLGRWLFYDTDLSSDHTISCATCHRPEFAFSEPRAVAQGIAGRQGRRKTPSLVNLGARTLLPGTTHDPGPTFFWDGRATSLEEQVLMPIADSQEMGMSHPAMITRLSEAGGYHHYFEEAFGSRSITSERVAMALADFVRSRKSGNAPYDRWAYGRDTNALSKEAQRGSDIFFFKGNCAACHAGFNFSDGLYWRLGVGWNAETRTFADVGRAAISHEVRDTGAFKTPGLREVEKRAPYMHDGSLATLRDVVEFYNRGGNRDAGPTPRLRPLGLSEEEKDALVVFLKSLNGEGYQDRAPRLFPR